MRAATHRRCHVNKLHVLALAWPPAFPAEKSIVRTHVQHFVNLEDLVRGGISGRSSKQRCVFFLQRRLSSSSARCARRCLSSLFCLLPLALLGGRLDRRAVAEARGALAAAPCSSAPRRKRQRSG